MTRKLIWIFAAVIVAAGGYLFATRILHPPVKYVIQPPTAGAPNSTPGQRAPERLAEVPANRPPTAAPRPGMPETAQQAPASRPGNSASPSPTGRPGMPHGMTPPGAPGGDGGERRMRPMQGTFALVRGFFGIGRLEREGKTPLTPAQAKAILAVMTPLRTQPTLTPEQAEKVLAQIKAQLTKDQLTAMETPRRWARPGGVGGPGGAGGQGGAGSMNNPGGMNRPDGQHRPDRTAGMNGGQPPAMREGDRPRGHWSPPGGGGQPGAPPVRIVNFNPFNTKSDNPMNERTVAIFTALEAKAKQ